MGGIGRGQEDRGGQEGPGRDRRGGKGKGQEGTDGMGGDKRGPGAWRKDLASPPLCSVPAEGLWSRWTLQVWRLTQVTEYSDCADVSQFQHLNIRKVKEEDGFTEEEKKTSQKHNCPGRERPKSI